MVNKWIEHVKKFRAKHPKMAYKEVLQKARPSYTPVKKGAKGKGLVGGKEKKKAPKKKGGTLVGGANLGKMENYQKEVVKKMTGKGLVGGKVKKAPKKKGGSIVGGTLVGGKEKKKRGRPKKGKGLKGGNFLDDLGKIAGAAAPFIPLLL